MIGLGQRRPSPKNEQSKKSIIIYYRPLDDKLMSWATSYMSNDLEK